MIRLGIVGVGIAGRARARAIAARTDAALVGVHRGRFAQDTGAPELSADALLAASDAVIVASPSGTHAAWVRRVLEAGRHAIVEYPLARTGDEARELFALARRVGRVLHVEHIERLAPTTRWMVEACEGWTGSTLLWTQGGDALPTASEHVWLQLARISRLVAALGWPSAFSVEQADGLKLRVRFEHGSGRVSSFHALRGPGLPRLLRWDVATPRGLRAIDDGRALADGVTVRLPEVALFATDLDVALQRMGAGGESYLPETEVVRLHDLIDRIGSADSSAGSVKAP